jgi:peroxiredoxin Q/BCP
MLLGASRDTPDALTKFKEKNSLPFHLLSDPKGELATAVGLAPGSRQTVVISKDGTIERSYLKVTAATHPAEALKDLGGK